MNADKLIPLNKVPKLLPKRDGKQIHLTSVYRWTTRGMAGVRLETQAGPYGTYTTEEALDTFWKDVATARRQRQTALKPIKADTAHKAAMKALDALGI